MRDLCATCFYASTSIVRLYFIDRRFGVSAAEKRRMASAAENKEGTRKEGETKREGHGG